MSAKGLEGNPAETGEIFYSQKTNGVDRRHPYFSCSNSKKKKIEDCICENVLRGESVRSLKKLQSREVSIKKDSELIDVVFDSKTTKHLSNDAVNNVNFFWNEIFPNVDKLLENARLVAHENNTKTDKKPSAIHYYYYECMVGKNVFYLNIEENYVVRENRHFYRLYSITHGLRDSAIMY